MPTRPSQPTPTSRPRPHKTVPGLQRHAPSRAPRGWQCHPRGQQWVGTGWLARSFYVALIGKSPRTVQENSSRSTKGPTMVRREAAENARLTVASAPSLISVASNTTAGDSVATLIFLSKPLIADTADPPATTAIQGPKFTKHRFTAALFVRIQKVSNSRKTCIRTSRAFRARRDRPYSSYPIDLGASVVGPD
jgi:hypothetical protein